MAARWYSPQEAARRLRVSESTLWRLLRRGRLPSVKVGGRRRISAAGLKLAARPMPLVLSTSEVLALGVEAIPPITLDDPLFKLAGKFRSGGKGPGASDKHFYLGKKL